MFAARTMHRQSLNLGEKQRVCRNTEILFLAIIITRNSPTWHDFCQRIFSLARLQLSKTTHILHFSPRLIATRPFENSIHHNISLSLFLFRYASLPDPPLTTMGSNVARHALAQQQQPFSFPGKLAKGKTKERGYVS